MGTRRWFSMAAAATLALCALGAGTSALASNTTSHPAGNTTPSTTSNQVKACYKKSTTLPSLDHVAGACPAGYSSLTWNKTGPQGPAGMSAGAAGTSGTSVVLDQAEDLAPVLSASAAPDSGTYYITASVMLVVAQGDTVTCILDNGAQTFGAFATVGPVANQTYETLPVSGEASISQGTVLQVLCADYTSNSATSFYNGAITSVLISNPSGGPSGSPSGSADHTATARHLPPRV